MISWGCDLAVSDSHNFSLLAGRYSPLCPAACCHQPLNSGVSTNTYTNTTNSVSPGIYTSPLYNFLSLNTSFSAGISMIK